MAAANSSCLIAVSLLLPAIARVLVSVLKINGCDAFDQ